MATAGIAAAALTFTTTGLSTAPAKSTPAMAAAAGTTAKPRVVITTDGEQDDQNTMVHYLMYSDEFDTAGLIYTSSQFHWAGDGNGTTFAGDCGPTATSCRWNGTSWIQTQLAAYAQEYKNLKSNDPNYPTPASLMDVVRVGNIDFPGEMSQDTDGSNLIKSLILDNKPGPLYLQAWGGLNTITRALDSIQLEYQNTPQWPAIYTKVSTKVIIEASGLFQDAPSNLQKSYLAPNWPRIQVNNLAGGYPVSSYPKIAAQPAENQLYYSGAWMKANIVDQGPLGALTYTYNHGPEASLSSSGPWGGTAEPDYTYVSDGDDVAFLPLIDTGLNSTNPAVASPDPTYGGWGGRLVQQTISPDLFAGAPSDTYTDGQPLATYDWSRWFPAEQLDFAARMEWGVTPKYQDANHEPFAEVTSGNTAKVAPGRSVQLSALATDPDGNSLTVLWWQYRDAGNYPGLVTIHSPNALRTAVTVPADAEPGQTIHIILQVTDNGTPALTAYQRVVITVR